MQRCAGGYQLPGNFNNTALPTDTRRLTIYGDHNVVYANFTAFPARSDLVAVWFWHFNELPTAEHIRFPFAQLLAHNKHHIQSLRFSHVKLLYLTEADLTGFYQLRSLDLDHAFLASVSASLFDSLGCLPSGDKIANYEPVLDDFKIISNPDLEALDWKFLQPVSNSLTTIWLAWCNLSSSQVVLSSAPFTLKKVTTITLANNPRLVPLPPFIYGSLSVSQNLDISLHGIPFCRRDLDCSCCEMQPFAKWLRDRGPSAVVRGIRCGTSEEWLTGANLTKPTLFDHCPNSRLV